MSFINCIDTAVLHGEITRQEGDRLKNFYSDYKNAGQAGDKAKENTVKELDAEAAARTRAALKSEQAWTEGLKDIHAYKTRAGDKDIAWGYLTLHEHLGHEGVMPYMDAETLFRALTGMTHAKIEGFLYEFRRGLVRGDLKRSPNWYGSKKTVARLDDVVRALKGEPVKGENEKALAAALRQAMDDVHLAINEAGGTIAKLDNYIPQIHRRDPVLHYGQEAWVKYFFDHDMFDREQMKNWATGEKMTDAELRDGMMEAWKSIVTNGNYCRELTAAPNGKGALWKRRLDHRFIHFKNADKWLQYARDFGDPDPYNALIAHLASMNRDLAHMKRFGPNPEALRTKMRNYIEIYAAHVQPFDRMVRERTERLNSIREQLSAHQQTLIERLHMIPDEIRDIREKRVGKVSRRGQKKILSLHEEFKKILSDLNGATHSFADLKLELEFRAALDDLDKVSKFDFVKVSDPNEYVQAILARADAIWESQRNRSMAPMHGFAHGLDTARNLLTSAWLGGSIIPSLNDMATTALRRGFVGMARGKKGIIPSFVQMAKHLAPATRREAVRSGLVLDSALHVFHQQSRFVGSIDTRSISGFLADRTIALQGLQAWTQAAKHAFGMDLMGLFADHVDMPFSKLPDLVRNTLERHGFTPAEWEKIRSGVALYEPEKDATFLRPQDIEAVLGEDAALKYLGMVLRETNYAIVEPTRRSSSLTWGGKGASPLVQELARTAGQFKSFTIAFNLMHWGQVLGDWKGGQKASAARYAARLLITCTLLGALSRVLKDLTAGKDPQQGFDEDKLLVPEFWQAAAAQGGGLGLYGDYLFSNLNRHGKSMGQSAGGPLWSAAEDWGRLLAANPYALATGKPTKFGADAIRILRSQTPIVSSLWYTKLAYNRILMDELQKLIDEDAYKSFNGQMSRAHNEFKQDFWWNPGEPSPRHAPRLEDLYRKR